MIKLRKPEPVRALFEAPYFLTEESVMGINLDFIIALTPALVWGVICFGLRALAVVLLSVCTAVISETVWKLIFRQRIETNDLSAVLCGLVLGLCLPASVPYWMPVAGAFVAVVLFKQLPKLFGRGFCVPAVGGYLFLSFFQNELTHSPKAFEYLSAAKFSFDVSELAEIPLLAVNRAELQGLSVFDLLLGRCPGAIGEVSVLLIAAGIIYLIWRRVLSWKLPVYMLLSTALISGLFPVTLDRVDSMFAEVFSGAAMLGLIVAFSDFSGVPVTDSGREIYAVACGALCIGLRYTGLCAEGAFPAIFIMNLLSVPLDRLLQPKFFGSGKQQIKEKKGKEEKQ